MEKQENERVVTLKDLWNIFIHRLWVIALAAVACVAGLVVWKQATFVPAYESKATLYILRQDDTDNTNNFSDDFSLALKVVNDCDYLLKSHSVLDKVIEELDLRITYKELARSVSTSNPDGTRILEVTVTSTSPEEAKRIVDSVCRVGTEKITEVMGVNQVNLYEYGTLNKTPCNRTRTLTYLMVGAAAAIGVYTVFLVVFLLDDRIRKDEDIETYLGLSILGSIPDSENSGKGKYGYQYGYYEKKKHGKRSGE